MLYSLQDSGYTDIEVIPMMEESSRVKVLELIQQVNNLLTFS